MNTATQILTNSPSFGMSLTIEEKITKKIRNSLSSKQINAATKQFRKMHKESNKNGCDIIIKENPEKPEYILYEIMTKNDPKPRNIKDSYLFKNLGTWKSIFFKNVIVNSTKQLKREQDNLNEIAKYVAP